MLLFTKNLPKLKRYINIFFDPILIPPYIGMRNRKMVNFIDETTFWTQYFEKSDTIHVQKLTLEMQN